MRTVRPGTVVVVAAVVLLLGLNTVQAGPSLWPKNKGEICLLNTGWDGINGPGVGEIARLAVVNTIGNNYLVHGFVTETDGRKSLFNGNAIVDEEWVLINVSSSGKNEINSGTPSNPHGFVGRVELEKSTLNGWVAGVGFYCDSTGCFMSNYDDIQYLNLIPCP